MIKTRGDFMFLHVLAGGADIAVTSTFLDKNPADSLRVSGLLFLFYPYFMRARSTTDDTGIWIGHHLFEVL